MNSVHSEAYDIDLLPLSAPVGVGTAGTAVHTKSVPFGELGGRVATRTLTRHYRYRTANDRTLVLKSRDSILVPVAYRGLSMALTYVSCTS